MDIWYTHQCTETWMLTMYFECQGPPYNDRGWTTWERTVAELISKDGYVLDLGKLDGSRSMCMSDIRKQCSAERGPPLPCERFDTLIEGKHFTCGERDLPMIKANWVA